MDAVLTAIRDTWLGQYAREHAWVFTTGLLLHFVGLCLLLGSLLVVDLRVLGVARSVPIRAVTPLLPVALVGFAINLLTGIVFICFDPFGYWVNPGFRIKMVLILVAGLNALMFTLVEQKRLEATPAGHDAGPFAKAAAALSILIWLLVILFGRLIVAFQGSPDLFT